MLHSAAALIIFPLSLYPVTVSDSDTNFLSCDCLRPTARPVVFCFYMLGKRSAGSCTGTKACPFIVLILCSLFAFKHSLYLPMVIIPVRYFLFVSLFSETKFISVIWESPCSRSQNLYNTQMKPSVIIAITHRTVFYLRPSRR